MSRISEHGSIPQLVAAAPGADRAAATSDGDDALRTMMFDHIREAALAWELGRLPRVLAWNRAAEQLYGHARADVMNRSPHVVLRTVFPISPAHTEATLRRDGRWSGELQRVAHDGTALTIDAQLELVELADGRAIVLEVGREITARRLEEAGASRGDELETVLDATPAAVWITRDREAREIVGSRAGYEMLRSPRDRNLSKTGTDLAAAAHFTVWKDGEELAPDQLPLQRAARGETVRDFSEEIRFDDGSITHIYGNAVPMLGPDGEPRGAIAAFVDVTAIREAEAALREVARRKDDFLAMLSHELRNPLAPIVAAVQLIKQQGDVATPRQREVLERQTAHLTKLVDDLLDVARVSRGKIELVRQPLELAHVVDKAVEMIRPQAERKRHALHHTVPHSGLCIEADDLRFTQIICNLLTNAVRYTPAGGHIWIDARRDGGDVVLRVRDTGMGISADLLPRVFEMFVQGAEHTTREPGGLGLGLSMVQRLVALHGGTVAIASDGPGTGTQVTVRIAAASRGPRVAGLAAGAAG